MSVEPAAQEAAPGELGRRTVRGVAWLTLQTLLVKLLQSLSLIPLAWLLSPEDFGLIGLVTTVAAFAGLAQQLGLREVLIHRQRELARWESPAFWMALTAGLAGAGLICAAAPLSRWLWDADRLPGLLLMLAPMAPLQAVALVPEAKLQSAMRFRLLTGIGLLVAAVQLGLAVALAAAGYGAASYVIPLPVAMGLRAVLLWLAARPRVRASLEVGRWRALAGDTAVVFATNFCYVAVGHGDYVVLGAVFDEDVLGLYFFAFSMAMVPLQMLGANMTQVLLPAFGHLGANPERQVSACLRASQLLAVVLVPVSLVQAVSAAPFVAVLFGERWVNAVPLLMILSAGMALRPIGWPSASLLQAQGRFPTRLGLAFGSTITLIGAVWIGSMSQDLHVVAIAVAVFYAAIGPITLYITLRPSGTTWRDLGTAFGPLVFAALVSSAAGLSLSGLLDGRVPELVRFLVVCTGGVAVYLALLVRVAPHLVGELFDRTGLRAIGARLLGV